MVLKYEFVSMVLIDFGCPCNECYIQLTNDLRIVSDVPSRLFLQLISVLQILQKSEFGVSWSVFKGLIPVQ